MRLIIPLFVIVFLSTLSFASISYSNDQINLDYDYIYKDVYLVQEGGSSWEPYVCSGNAYSDFWYQDCSIDTKGKAGTYFVATYACDLVNNQFDCNNNQWRIQKVDIIRSPPNPEPTPEPGEWIHECNDGIDNDGDGLVDKQDDKGTTEGKKGASLGCFGPNRQETTQDYGFSLVTKTDDTRIIYVSASGSDNNDGLSPQKPVKTVLKGLSLARAGYSDWVLLKTGDQWAPSKIYELYKKGKSPDAPFVLSTYGVSDVRPKIIDKRIHIKNDNMIVRGLHMHAVNSDHTAAGIYFFGRTPLSSVIIEDTIVQGYYQNVIMTRSSGTIEEMLYKNVLFNRNIVIDGNGNDRSQGFYIQNTQDLVLRQNFIDKNGYENGKREGTEGHNTYTHPLNEPILMEENVITRAGANVNRPGSGVTFVNNFMSRNPIGPAINFGGTRRYGLGWESGLINNVMLEGEGLHSSGANSPLRGWGFQVESLGAVPQGQMVRVTGNVIAHRNDAQSQTFNPAIMVYSNALERVDISNNKVYKWLGSARSRTHGISTNLLKDTYTHWDDKNGNQVGVNFVDPERTLAEYYHSQILGNTKRVLSASERDRYHDEFVVKARQRPLGVWWPEYSAPVINDWIREGFEVR